MKSPLPQLTFWGSMLLSSAAMATQVDTRPAPEVDLGRYLGLWHETARFDNVFERGLHAVTALYERMADGSLRVTNSGTASDGHRFETTGKARQKEGATRNSALEVSFVPPYAAFFSDYRILYVTPDYSGALVSDADGDNLWLLERSAEGNPRVQEALLNEAERRGFDTAELIYSEGEDAPESEAEINPE